MSSKVKVYVEIDRGGIIETRGALGTEDEVRDSVAYYRRHYGADKVLRVRDELGRDITDQYGEER